MNEYDTVIKIIKDDAYALKIHAEDYGIDINDKNEVDNMMKEIRDCLAFPDEAIIYIFNPEELNNIVKNKYFKNR